MTKLLITLPLVVLSASGANAETASPWVDSHSARVRLIAGRVATADGGRLAAGVELEMAAGWKTYWRNPGDSGGVPPVFDWSASTNIAGAAVHYPAPLRLKDDAGDSIGYKERVVFPITIAPKDTAKPAMLKLALEFGVCREICVPATASLELALPPSIGTAPDALAAAFDRVPRAEATLRPNDPVFKGGTVNLDGGKPSLTFEAGFPGGFGGADAYIEAPDGIYVPLPTPMADQGSVRRFMVELDTGVEPRDLKGKTLVVTLVSDAGSSEFGWRVD